MTVINILELIEHELEYPDDRNNSVSPINQWLCALRFYASSGHLVQTANFMRMDVSAVSSRIARLFLIYVKMPTQREIITEQNKFYNVGRFPRVIGLVNGTQIRIQSLGGNNAEVYRNRKAYFSVNVQVVGNADLKFVDVEVRWPGSTHDATIFANSNLRARFENNMFPGCLLIGDIGYPLRNYFMTPLLNSVTAQEQLYNESLIRTRNIIERIIGIWKRLFPIAAYGMRLDLEVAKEIIIATTVLHNIARNINEPEPSLPEDMNNDDLNYLIAIQDLNLEAPIVNNFNFFTK